MAEIFNLRLKRFDVYRNGLFTTFPADTEQTLTRDRVEFIPREDDRSYTVKYGDSIDKIAFWAYGGERPNPAKYWWAIADANDIENPLDLTGLVGAVLRIPSMSNIDLNT